MSVSPFSPPMKFHAVLVVAIATVVNTVQDNKKPQSSLSLDPSLISIIHFRLIVAPGVSVMND